MAVQNLKLTKKIEAKLGQEGLQQVAAHLWARDCQTCGKSLGAEPPALYVIDMHTYAFAELNHEACRTPDWNDSGFVTRNSSNDAYLSHETFSAVLPFSKNGAVDLRPSLLVNPGLEAVWLELDEQDNWQVQIEKRFDHAGLRPLGQIPMDSPVKGATAKLTRSEIAVTFTDPPFSTYSAPIAGPSAPKIRAAHKDKQGVLVIVSHLFDFTTPTPEHISAVFSSGKVRSGWVGFAKDG
ncbi:hypothetical protein ACFWTE_28380 [Nocardiopsis sp. NPDC058631]|uniref:hypothetical protein n=1 Tax=Nocardiopsis sp. NPDC058631 TaxID=3346566 RepID=UPI003659D1DC